MRRFRSDRHSLGVFYGFDAETGQMILPEGGIEPIDDVTGQVIDEKEIDIQDGLVKSNNPRRGSWENNNRHAKDQVFITYDLSLGVQSKPAGEI